MAAAPSHWMMLERFVFRRDDAESFPDAEAAPFKVSASTSLGDPFTVAFRIAEPPDISRLYLQWPRGPKEGSSCHLVAAHRNLLLFRLTSSNSGESLIYPQDHFICRALSSSPPYQPLLTLQKIPMCTTPVVLRVNNGKEITGRRSFHLHTVGILCRGEEEFAMAQLDGLSRLHLGANMEANLCVLRSNVYDCDHKWEVEQHLPIQCKEDEESDLIYWRTDRAIPFQNYLCFVDYSIGGILFCEVFQKRPTISYLRLPVHNQTPGYYRLPYGVRPFHDMNRCVCITQNYHELKFVDVAHQDRKHFPPMKRGVSFTVTYHGLRTTEDGNMVWNEVFVITSDELWALNTSLPREALMFPLVSMDRPNMVHFLLSEKGRQGIDKVSVVSIDMSTKAVVSIHPYIKGEEDLQGKDADMVWRKSHLLQPFMPSEFPKFLHLTRSNQ